MTQATGDVWEVLATSRAIRRFTDEPVDGATLLRCLEAAIGIPDEWVLAGHIVVGWPRGHFGPVRRRPVSDVVFRNAWERDRADIIYGAGARPEPG